MNDFSLCSNIPSGFASIGCDAGGNTITALVVVEFKRVDGRLIAFCRDAADPIYGRILQADVTEHYTHLRDEQIPVLPAQLKMPPVGQLNVERPIEQQTPLQSIQGRHPRYKNHKNRKR
ncbi:MAG TPA: hypothetical protein VGN00_14135 [Puia sp.]|jgi:hypothetical protein